MTPEEYVAMDATGLAEAIRGGQLSATQAVDAAIERLEALNGWLNAVTETSREPALECARRSPACRSSPRT